MPERCKSSTLLYADTGEGKTAQIGGLAKHFFRTTGLKTRYYTAEPGASDTIEHLVEAGIVDIFDLTTAITHLRPSPFAREDGGPAPMAN